MMSLHDYIVVGNGAAELIKSVMGILNGKVGVVYPTFEEYPNRLAQDRIIPFYPCNDDFCYTADDLIRFYSEKRVENLLVVNPDNPSGNLIDKNGLTKLGF